MSLPTLPTTIFPDPGTVLQELVPGAVVPTFIPQLQSYAQRVTAKTKDYTATLPDGTTKNIAGATLTFKLAGSGQSPEGDYHEFYIGFRGGDPEAIMDLHTGPTVPTESIRCEISRMCGAILEIYVDNELVHIFPVDNELGYFGLNMPA